MINNNAARLSALAMAALLSFASPAQSQSNISVVRVHVPMTPLNNEGMREVQRAADGDIIWTQRLATAQGARLHLPVLLERSWERGRFRIEIPQGEALFEVHSENNRRVAFCTLSVTWSRFYADAFHQTSRACLLDADEDGQFESVADLNESANYDSSQDFDPAQIAGAGFGGTTLLRFPIDPVGYDLVTLPEPATSTVAIQLKGSRLVVVGVVPGANRLMVEGHWVRGSYIESSTEVSLPGRRRLPATVTILGAEIEVVSRDGSGIRYRVLRGFSGDAINVSLRPF